MLLQKKKSNNPEPYKLSKLDILSLDIQFLFSDFHNLKCVVLVIASFYNQNKENSDLSMG